MSPTIEAVASLAVDGNGAYSLLFIMPHEAAATLNISAQDRRDPTLESFRRRTISRTALSAPAPPPTTPVAIAPEKLAGLQVGVDEDGNFYRGDPNAPIRLVDFSDYQ